MTPLTKAQRQAAARKAAATRKRNAAAAAKKGTPPTKSKTPSKAKAPAKKTSSAKSTTPTTVPAPVQTIWTWLKKYWWIVLIVIALVWLFFKFALPWMSILEQRNNAAIANAQSQQAAPVTVATPVTAVAAPINGASQHELWSLYGKPSFIVSDGTSVESGSDMFTDASKGGLTVSVSPTEPTCLLQHGITSVYTEKFSAAFPSGEPDSGFRIIAKSYWDTLTPADGAYKLCWPRQ